MRKHITVIITVLLSFLCINILYADPVTRQQAQKASMKWLTRHEGRPLKTPISADVLNIDTYTDDDGSDLYYVVNFNPTGFVIVSADDLIEPVIAFAEKGSYTPADTHPLGAMVSKDMRQRMAHIRNSKLEKSPSGTSTSEVLNKAKNKWEALLLDSDPNLETRLTSIPTVRVSPLVGSTWDQSTVNGNNCYNYWTPNHYVCGCVATAMAQLIRYHSWPTTGIGVSGFTIHVDGVSQTVSTHGGDNAGGAYIWNSMPLSPNAATTDTDRKQIGYLTADAGYAVNMSYASNGSGADTLETATALKNTFKYSNAVKGYNSGSNMPSTSYTNMINANLDATLPVLFGITGAPGGHAVVGDGYGYDALETMYHHLNLGWGSTSGGLTANAWYNLPNVDTPYYTFNSLYKVVYNVYKTGTGEVISGRVTDADGNPLSGVTVTGTVGGGGTFSNVTGTNANLDSGIYALTNIPSNSSVTLTAVKSGYQFSPQTVTTGRSTDYSSISGNIGNAHFQGQIDLSSSFLYANFTSSGLYRYNGTTWTLLTAGNPEAMAAAGSLLYTDFGSNGIWMYSASTWSQLTPGNPEAMAAAGSLLYADFGSNGIWMYNGTTWSQLTPGNSENIAAAGSLMYADFGTNGVWMYNGTTWNQLTPGNPEAMAVAGSLLYTDFGSNGIWQCNGTTWTLLTAGNPEAMAAAGSLLYADFGSNGIWQYNGTTWTLLTAGNPEAMAAAGSLLYADFGSNGVWMYNGSTWSQLTPGNPEAITAGN